MPNSVMKVSVEAMRELVREDFIDMAK